MTEHDRAYDLCGVVVAFTMDVDHGFVLKTFAINISKMQELPVAFSSSRALPV